MLNLQDKSVILYPKTYEFDKKPTEISMLVFLDLLAKPIDPTEALYRVEIDGIIKTVKEWKEEGIAITDFDTLGSLIVQD